MKTILNSAFVFLFLCGKSQILIPTPETAFEKTHNFNAELIKQKNVNKITFEIVDKKDFEIAVDKNLVETYEFDTNGKLSRFYYTTIVKTIEKQITASVHNKGKKGYHTVTETKSEYLYDTVSTTYFYNKANLSLKRYHDGALFYESRYYRYDSLNNLVKEMRYRETNNSTDKSIFILGGQLLLSQDSFVYKKYSDQQLHCFHLNNEQRPYKQQIIYFDSLGRTKSTTEYYTAAAWIKQEKNYEYVGSHLSSAIFKGNANKEITIKITYEYDANNELLTEKQYKNEVLEKELSYITNSSDNLLSSLVVRDYINKSIRIIKLKYEFRAVTQKSK
ncbi:MAG: hypothetical protein IPM51_09245 [Sphingobacteriaceae bacterium]|nr:hypothetical protein [Sphingobacteriaceae bacterium]